MTTIDHKSLLVLVISSIINGNEISKVKEDLVNQGYNSEDLDKAVEVIQDYLDFIRETWRRHGFESEIPRELVNSILANTLLLYKKQASSLRMCMEWCAMQQIAKEAENK